MIDPRPERMGRRALIAGAGATAALVSGRRASAALPSEAGILVGAFLGSPYDIHARILVRHLHRLYPAIRAQVETMPRAGGKLAAKLVYDSAGDGRTLAMLPSGLIFAELLGEEGVAGAAADPPMMKLLDSSSTPRSCRVIFTRLALTNCACP